MTAIVVCISDQPDERARLAAAFDTDDGVLVIASSAAAAQEFLARLSAPAPEVPSQELEVDPLHHEARWRGRPLPLTPHELKVLGCLARHPGRVWTYEQLHEAAWDEAYYTGRTAVQSVVKRLRAKLLEAGVQPRIEAARGLGFRLSGRTDLHVVRPDPRAG